MGVLDGRTFAVPSEQDGVGAKWVREDVGRTRTRIIIGCLGFLD